MRLLEHHKALCGIRALHDLKLGPCRPAHRPGCLLALIRSWPACTGPGIEHRSQEQKVSGIELRFRDARQGERVGVDAGPGQLDHAVIGCVNEEAVVASAALQGIGAKPAVEASLPAPPSSVFAPALPVIMLFRPFPVASRLPLPASVRFSTLADSVYEAALLRTVSVPWFSASTITSPAVSTI